MTSRTEFSLFEGDPLNRFLLLFGIRSSGYGSIASRFLFVLLLTYIPTMLFCLFDGYFWSDVPRAMNMFGDVGAICQVFLGYPLFFIAEVVVGKKTRATARHFSEKGLITPEELPQLEALHDRMVQIRRSVIPDIICLSLAYAFSLFWLWEETHNASNTWHAIGVPGLQWPTMAGWWIAIVGIPVFNYLWLRWIWKIVLWSYYLRKISKFKLRLIASHPDMTGGLAFLSSTQASFAIVIFAFGIGIIAPLVAYKLDIENAEFWSFATAAPLISFAVGAPLFFSVPLLFFTKKLSRIKSCAMDDYQDRATEAAIHFEKKWLKPCHGDDCDTALGTYLSGMNNLNNAYNHIKKMRVVPFDATSFSQLFASTFGSLIPLLPKLIDLPEPVLKLLDVLKPLIGK